MANRLHVNISDSTDREIEELCRQLDLTKTEVVRKAVKLLHYVESQRAIGRALFTTADDGRTREVVPL